MILVELLVPSMDESFDFLVDENATIDHVIDRMDEILSQKTRKDPGEDRNPFMLCFLDHRVALSRNRTLAQEGVKDGSRLMLV